MATCCVTSIVYFVIISQIVGGISQLFGLDTWNHNYEDYRTYSITFGIVAILLGLLLLAGLIQQNSKLVYAYLIGNIINLILLSVYGVWRAVQADTVHIIGTIIGLGLLWLLQYCIYLYYKELIESNATLNSAKEARIEREENLKNITA